MDITKIPYPVTFAANRAQLPSRARPAGTEPVGIIIHSMAQFLNHKGKKVHAPDFLTEIGLSAHGYVEPDGSQIHSVPTDRIAYHAGRSRLGDYENLNTQWLGTEVLVQGTHNIATLREAVMNGNPFTDEQYRSTAMQCHYWMHQHPTIRKEYIVGHNEVSGPDVRPDPKFDPGAAWSWETFWRWFDLTEQAIESGKIEEITQIT